jgi:hypothetical protein
MKRDNRFLRGAVTAILAITSTLAGTACSVQKTKNSAGKDTATVSAPAPASATTTVQPAASDGRAIVEDSGKVDRKPASKPAVKTPAAGGEHDSATQAVFEIGPDGKIRRVKR